MIKVRNYVGWHDVPPTYRLKSDMARFGLKLAPNQQKVATVSGPTGTFALYDTTQCVPMKKRKAQP